MDSKIYHDLIIFFRVQCIPNYTMAISLLYGVRCVTISSVCELLYYLSNSICFMIVISTTPFSMFTHWLHFSWTLILVKNKHIQYASTYWRWSWMVFIKLWRLIQTKYFFISQFFHLSWDVSIFISSSLMYSLHIILK